MKGIILVGGEGTRLRPLTCNTPKPMVPVLNRPFLEHMIEHLSSHGIDDIILTLCYLPDHIQSHFGDGSKFGVKLTYIVEESPLGTAGAVKNIEDMLDDPIFVFNGDIFTELDLTEMLSLHYKRGAKVTIALTPVNDPTIYGLVETDRDGRVRRFIEKPSWDAVTTNMINAGSYILEREVLEYIPPSSYFTFERGLFPGLLKMGEAVYGYPSNTYWIDIGTPERYMKLHHDLMLGGAFREGVRDKLNIHPTAEINGPVALGKDCVIGPGVLIMGPTVIGDGCRIEEGSVIEGAILWRNVHIGNRVVLKNCIIADNTIAGDGCGIDDGSIIGENVIIGNGNKLARGIRVWPEKRLEAETISF